MQSLNKKYKSDKDKAAERNKERIESWVDDFYASILWRRKRQVTEVLKS